MTFSVLQYIFIQLSHFEAFRWKEYELCVFRERIINNVSIFSIFFFYCRLFFSPSPKHSWKTALVIRERNICRFMFILVRLWKFCSLEEGIVSTQSFCSLFSGLQWELYKKANSFSIKWKHEALKLGNITEMN